MQPTMFTSDLIEIQEFDGDIKLGDIVVYLDHAGELIAHRIISLTPLRAKGDNSLLAEQISRDQIISKIKSIESEKSIQYIHSGVISKLQVYSSRMLLVIPKMRRLNYVLNLFLRKFLSQKKV